MFTFTPQILLTGIVTMLICHTIAFFTYVKTAEAITQQQGTHIRNEWPVRWRISELLLYYSLILLAFIASIFGFADWQQENLFLVLKSGLDNSYLVHATIVIWAITSILTAMHLFMDRNWPENKILWLTSAAIGGGIASIFSYALFTFI